MGLRQKRARLFLPVLLMLRAP